MWLTSMSVINFELLNVSNRAIGIINFEKTSFQIVFAEKFKVGLKSLLQQGLSEPELYGVLVY